MNKLRQLNNPSVSIIVPVYGVERYLQKCIDSLLGQTFQDIEIILIDDGSKDASGKICDKNALKYPQIIKVVHQTNTGLGGARNTGIKLARGKFLIFVDSDDYIRKDTVEIAYSAISGSEVDIVAFGIYFVNGDGRVIKNKLDGPAFDESLNLRNNAKILLSSPSAWNKIYKTELFDKHDIWFPQRAWHEDVRTTFKLYAVAKSIMYIQESLYYYVQRSESITHNANIERNKEIIDAIEDLIRFYQEKGIFEDFHDELEYIAILNMYNAASARVASIDPRNHLLADFRDFLLQVFPGYKSNRYITEFSLRQKFLFFLVERKMYKLIRALNVLRNKIDGGLS